MRTLLLLLFLLPTPAYAQAVWGNRTYNSPVCSRPNCAMCNAIRAQLASQVQAWPQVSITTPIIPQSHTNQPQLPASVPTPQSTQLYQTVSVPYTVTVKKCNGVTCWYENETRYRLERQLVTAKVTKSPNLLYVTTLAPTPGEAVAHLLKIANPLPGEILYDIGCGDGRILIAATTTYGCRSVGIELNPESVKLAQESINVFGLQDKIRVYEGDALKFEYPHADVVTMYLYPELMEKVLPLLKSQTRVVSYLHPIPGAKKHEIGEHVFYEWTTP